MTAINTKVFISRRNILKAGVAGATLFLPLPYAWVWAQSDGAMKLLRLPKLALVLGNSKYARAPSLINPANDAKAISEVLTQSGFDVTSKLDATLDEMAAAIKTYVQALSAKKAVGLFYFAGHGVQLSWRNYLVPVDAAVRRPEDIQKSCVDLSLLIEGINKASNPMNVVILDACRDNPFGADARLEARGLSQMDAPHSTLLAYATAPGNVASDGEGANGIYTENLLREMKAPDAKIEDIFKRVRLHVRRRTNGQQIPWESTSLEEDFYFLPPKALAIAAEEAAERERKLEIAAREKQRAAEEAERKGKQETAAREAKLAAEGAERKRQQEIATFEQRRHEEDAERKRKQELALKEAQQVAEESERKRREERAMLEAKRAEEEAERQYKQQLALREKQRVEQDAERKRKEDDVVRETMRAEEERKRKEEVARQETERQRPQQTAAIRKADPAVAESQYQEEFAIWEKIKTASEPGLLEDYLLRYPSGRFSELAQFHLDRLLARKGEKKIEAVFNAANPFTKGTVRADTNYKVGDIFRYREMDVFTKVESRVFAQRVTETGDNEVFFNNGNLVTDLLGNIIRNQKVRFTGTQFYIPEYTVGKRWSARYQRFAGDFPARDVNYDFKVVAREKITVPAGTFDAFKIEGAGWTRTNDDSYPINLQTRYWIAPGIRRGIASENLQRVANPGGRYIASERVELVSYVQT